MESLIAGLTASQHNYLAAIAAHAITRLAQEQPVNVTAPCPHCPDGHGSPYRTHWAVWVAPDTDSDGQPIYLRVQPTAGAHVAEADAEWLRTLIRERPRP